MVKTIFSLAVKSIKHYRKQVLYQVLITAILSAVITGSLLTGKSIRKSLKKSAGERLGNSEILISSGVRYFNDEIVPLIKNYNGVTATGILELKGYCQNFNSQKGAFNVNIIASDTTFFSFQGNDSVKIRSGEAAVNRSLANYLGVKEGDELIIRYNQISDIPADAPFAPENKESNSVVMKIGEVLEPSQKGNFSLSISQIMPMNVFVRLSDIRTSTGTPAKINRLLINTNNKYSPDSISRIFIHCLKPEDIGLNIRKSGKTGETELISDRIFIDALLVKNIKNLIPSSAPLITYMGNRFISGSGITPYSFIAALPSSLYRFVSGGDSILINRWMSEDLSVNAGDSIKMVWYAPDSLDKLIEKSSQFIVSKVVDMQGIWADSLLMPEFPGISGSASCSDWDAGVPVKLDEIRNKDEDYWKKYKGTPKAFISYKKGMELWGNNYGPATAIRFPSDISVADVEKALSGKLEPDIAGFTITDLLKESTGAADGGVDFSSLFLSLGFFLILASVVLLSFAVTSYFISKEDQISTLFKLGFTNNRIGRLLFIEALFFIIGGCLFGAFSGLAVNYLIIRALNTVWSGAVQTTTLSAFFDAESVLYGFLVTTGITLIFMYAKIRLYLKKLSSSEKEIQKRPSAGLNLTILFTSVVATAVLLVIGSFSGTDSILYFFSGGTLFLASLILLWRQYYISQGVKTSRTDISVKFYSLNPAQAISPILFIAAGIFVVFITGANKMDSGIKSTKRNSGTGGYLLWCENTIPVPGDINSLRSRKLFGIDADSLAALSFVEIKRQSGNDASCLNLNYITAPSVLGVDPSDFIARGAFTFASQLNTSEVGNSWMFLDKKEVNNTIYGIADQTVLDWGLKISVGDTLILRAESGQRLNVIIAGGLKPSVFQGNLLIGMGNFMKYFPSVAGSSVFLIDGKTGMEDAYKKVLNNRFEGYGIHIEECSERLASFHQVTNTYLSVFGVFGAFGMITGIAGLGFVLLRNYNSRKKEFAVMLATGFSTGRIKRIVFGEQLKILFAGVSSGIIAAIIATLPSLKNNQEMPWLFLSVMIAGIILTGITVLILSLKSISSDSLIITLKKE